MCGSATNIAVDVDLDAVEHLLADEMMCIADLRFGKERAHKIVEGFHQPVDEMPLPRPELEMAAEIRGAIDSPCEHRVGRFDRLDEQRIG